MNRRQTLFLLFCCLLAVLSALVIGRYGSANRLFSGAYQPAVQEYNQRHQQAEPERATNEPKFQGIRERDIEKHRGNRYSTY